MFPSFYSSGCFLPLPAPLDRDGKNDGNLEAYDYSTSGRGSKELESSLGIGQKPKKVATSDAFENT